MIPVSLRNTPCSGKYRSLFCAKMIPVSVEYRSLLISDRMEAKTGRNARADWLCEARRVPEPEIGFSKNI